MFINKIPKIAAPRSTSRDSRRSWAATGATASACERVNSEVISFSFGNVSCEKPRLSLCFDETTDAPVNQSAHLYMRERAVKTFMCRKNSPYQSGAGKEPVSHVRLAAGHRDKTAGVVGKNAARIVN